MATRYTPENYQYYTQSTLLNLPSKSKNKLADDLLKFNINQLSPDEKAEFYQNLSTFRMPDSTVRKLPSGMNTRDFQKRFQEAGIAYNKAVAQKMTEIENSGLPDVPDIELDINDEKTFPQGINKVTNEPTMENPTMGGKQRKVSCGCSKRGKSRSQSKQRGKSRTRSKSRGKSRSKYKK